MLFRRAIIAMLGCVVLAAPIGMPGAAAGGPGINYIRGTDGRDIISGTGHADLIRSFAGNDRITPRAGADRVRAGAGDDTIFLIRDGRVDRIACGPGFDVIVWDLETDPRDVIADGCEGQIA